nr:immunoglobulin heavy chain junction region [Macaca mulatta]MOV86648.1 immunoglobulin heavy chain junction region [Macaca mulatta]MOV86650.1 immunoglobulin heavy chain junction region [Macaca mulatta]MOV86663.1 immunoglobulin heavy chain junction region [Macaca mulatta]MOV86672.1 immunoglobulin heavy chain junction region [Macaca mulatta]
CARLGSSSWAFDFW